MTGDEFIEALDGVVNFAKSCGLRHQDAADVSQDTAVRCLLAAKPIEDMNRSYVIKVGQNIIRRRFRKAKRRKEVAIHEGMGTPAPATTSAMDDVTAALRAIPYNEREAVENTVCLGMSYAACSIVQGCTESQVNNWKHRGLTKIRKQLDLKAA